MERMLVLGVHDAPLDDREVIERWSASGAQWLTDPAIGVPGRLVRRVVGLVDQLDRRGAGLGGLVAARGVGLLAERAAVMGLPPSGSTSAGGASQMVECDDGWLALSLARDADVDLLPAWLEHDVGAEGHPWDAVHRIARRRAVGELVERAAMLGLPCAAIGEVDDPRPAVATRVDGGPEGEPDEEPARRPDGEPARRPDGEPAGRPDGAHSVDPGDVAPRDVAGAVVVSLAALWAGPLAGDVLARLGARLITVESTARPDGGRLDRRFFAALHGRSESVALDLTDEQGRTTLGRLLRRADIVIEGSRPRALEQMGLDARQLVLEGGPRVWLSITAHGRDGPARHRVGFGDDTAAAGGLVGRVGDAPRFVADAVADPLTGLTAALAGAELLERGGCWLVDVALARTARAARGDWLTARPEVPARPRPRRDPGRAMPLGRDTRAALHSLDVETP